MIRLIYRTELRGGTLTDEVQGSTDRCSWWSYEDIRDLPLVSLAELGVSLAFS
ncbi:MAG TPA: hypothetical protein VLA12_22455 [Planctomycetaceae bacterium]|nr:hypothetical protein [Planctomycetaceae bacterium]